MRRAFITVVAAGLAGSPVAASEWWYAGATASVVAFVDAGTLSRDRAYVEFWQFDVFRAPVNGIGASKRRKRVDCTSFEARLLQAVDYDEAGRPNPPLVYTLLPQRFSAPRSAADAGAHRFACAASGERSALGAEPAADPSAAAAAVFARPTIAGR